MAKLDASQIEFLKKHGISLSTILDASGLTKRDREIAMTEIGANFYYSDSLCQKAGHALRTKPGHCIQCDTSKIAFQSRSSASGYVYLAQAAGCKLLKIGYSNAHPADRIQYLNREAYGGVPDWDLKKVVYIDSDAGRTEFLIHSILEHDRANATYTNQKGVVVECKEIFSCSLDKALRAFATATQRVSPSPDR